MDVAAVRDDLTQEDKNDLAYICETSVGVRRRHQFFSWAQGPVQTLLPHEILICAVRDSAAGALHVERFSATRYFRDEHLEAVLRPNDGVLARIMGAWERSGQPCVAPVPAHARESYPHCPIEWGEALRRNELKNAASHGVHGVDGGVQGFFTFARVAAPLDSRLGLLLELLVPCLYATYIRMLREEGRESAMSTGVAPPLSGRELEVLHWVALGKTNAEIGEILEVSQFTIKNHVQNAIRKFGVRTRGQAVARAVAMRLLGEG
jgi:transcriptional regulator EpsA